MRTFPALKEAHPELLARHWTEAGEAEPAIAEWTTAGKAAEARNAFREALESYQQALAVLALLPKSPERDSRELGLKQSTVSMLSATNGYAAPETTEAIEQALSLAEKSGDVTQLANWLTSRASAVLVSGDLAVAGALANRVLQLALPAQRTAIKLGEVYQVQIITRYFRGDLAGSEKHFGAWGEFFSDGRLRPPIAIAVNTLAFWQALMLGCSAGQSLPANARGGCWRPGSRAARLTSRTPSIVERRSKFICATTNEQRLWPRTLSNWQKNINFRIPPRGHEASSVWHWRISAARARVYC